MQIIGAGLGRTGTFSLKHALETLGFGPCFHMYELFQKPERAPIFTAAAKGEDVNWDDAFSGFNSTLDWPSAAFYAQLAERYPDAKVILTTRDADRWHASCMDTIAFRGDASHAVQEPDYNDPVQVMIDTVIWRGTFNRRFDQKEEAIAIYNRHNAEVRDRIPAGRLLDYQVSQGWEPLCAFLGVAVPSEPFPHVNDRDSFRKQVLNLED